MGIATITTKGYCLVNEGLAVQGSSKEEIVNKMCKFEFVNNQLIIHIKFYKPIKSITYSNEYGDSWTKEERYKDAIKVIFQKLQSMYPIYRDVGF
jgi:uncharacterized protein (DUF1919 family)